MLSALSSVSAAPGATLCTTAACTETETTDGLTMVAPMGRRGRASFRLEGAAILRRPWDTVHPASSAATSDALRFHT